MNFYTNILGLEVSKNNMGLQILLPSKDIVYVYQKDDHQPATYTILNISEDDIKDPTCNIFSILQES